MARCAVGIFVARKMPGLYPSRRGTWLTLPKGHPPQIWKDEVEYYQIIDYQFIISSIICFEFLIKGAYTYTSKSPIFECSKMTSWQSLKHQAFFGCSIVYGHGTLECDRGNSRCLGVLVSWEVTRWISKLQGEHEDFVGRIQNCIILTPWLEKTEFSEYAFHPKPEMIGCSYSWFHWEIFWFGMGIFRSPILAFPEQKAPWGLHRFAPDEVLFGDNVCLISLEMRPYVSLCSKVWWALGYRSTWNLRHFTVIDKREV